MQLNKVHSVKTIDSVAAELEPTRDHPSQLKTGPYKKCGLRRMVTEKRCLTQDELVAEPREGHGVEAHRVSIWRRLRGFGLTHKKRPAR